MRPNLYKKLCFIIVILTLLILSYTLLSYSSRKPESSRLNSKEKKTIIKEGKDLKYILLWTPSDVPFWDMKEGKEGFNHCPHKDCYVTTDRTFLDDYTNFDAIVFSQHEVVRMYDSEFPEKRSLHQKYVFASFKPAEADYPVCSKLMDEFFNWTWTYRLDSDIRSNPIIIKDIEGNIYIGPKKEMNWIKPIDMKPVDETEKDDFKLKSEIAMRIVSNCETNSRSAYLSNELKKEFQNINQNIHEMYYDCKEYLCSYDDIPCEDIIKKDYLFFMSFEISFDEDYVTDRLLFALLNRAIPIVYGGANYSRFMPEGAFINAKDYTPKELVKTVMDLMTDIDKYTKFFKWTNHYKYEKAGDSEESDEYCRLCSLLHDEGVMKEYQSYENFRDWWNPNACG